MRCRSLLVAGDLNAELAPGSCIAAMLDPAVEGSEEELRLECAKAMRLAVVHADEGDDGEERDESVASRPESALEPALAEPSEAMMTAWRQLRLAAEGGVRAAGIGLSRVPLGATRAAYPADSSEGYAGPCEGWALDHVLYTPRSLRLVDHWSTLEADPQTLADGLPTASHPSDHLPVAARFAWSAEEGLPTVEADSLRTRWAALRDEHWSALSRLGAHFEARLETLQVEEAAAAAAAAAAAGEPPPAEPAAPKIGKKGKKVGRRGPPSEATMTLMREKRVAEKALKEEQRQQRDAFVEALGEREREYYEDELEK